MNLPSLQTIITVALGAIGTTLGVVNFIRDIMSSRVRLRIRCYPFAILQPGNILDNIGCVEVVNLSSFPVTLKEVAFEPRVRQSGRFTVRNDGCLNDKRLPVRIDPRDSVQIIYKDKNSLETMVKQSRRVIAETACGKICFGKLKHYHDIIKKCERNALKEDM